MFRITGGLYRGTKLRLPPKDITRPTSSRARESLFNCLFSLDFNMVGATVIDCFAGSGAIGLECLSRGAGFCTFIECDPVVQTILKENIKTLKMTDSSEISPSFKAIQKSPTKTREDAIEKTREKKGVDFIFLDPPYFSQEGGIPLYSHALTSLKEFIGPGTLIVIETDAKEMVMKDEPTLDTLSFLFEKIYGTVKLSFYKKSFLA